MKSTVLRLVVGLTIFGTSAALSAGTCYQGQYNVDLGYTKAKFSFRLVEAADGRTAAFSSIGLNGDEVVNFFGGAKPVKEVYPNLNLILSRLNVGDGAKCNCEIYETQERGLRAYFELGELHLVDSRSSRPKFWPVTEFSECQ